MQDKTHLAIEAWKLYHQKHYAIPTRFRTPLRMVPGFVPECGNVCPELTLHILTTDTGVVRCLHHSMNRSVTRAQNDLTQSPRDWSLTGTPFEADNDREVSLAGGLLSCGCQIENALLDFYLFKTGRLWSPSKSQWEDWRSQRIHPRVHELVLAQVKLETLWGLDNIWCYKADDKGNFTVFVSESERWTTMLERQKQRIAETQEKEKQAAAGGNVEHNQRVEEEMALIVEDGTRGQREWEAKLAEKAAKESRDIELARKRDERLQRKAEKARKQTMRKGKNKVDKQKSNDDKGMGKED